MSNKLEILKEYKDSSGNTVYGFEELQGKLCAMYKMWHNRPLRENYKLQREWWIDSQGCRLIYDVDYPCITPEYGFKRMTLEDIEDKIFLGKLRGKVK